jgi:DNA-binding XRE family transcriptional regulator
MAGSRFMTSSVPDGPATSDSNRGGTTRPSTRGDMTARHISQAPGQIAVVPTSLVARIGRFDRSLTVQLKYFLAGTSFPADSMAMCSSVPNMLRRTRLELALSQTEFAALLGVPDQTYRTWESGRRRVPRPIVCRARRLKETDAGRLQPLSVLANQFRIHVRTLRKARSSR